MYIKLVMRMCIVLKHLLRRQISSLFVVLLCFYGVFYTATYLRFYYYENDCRQLFKPFGKGGQFQIPEDPFMLVAVMTTRNKLDKHAKTIYETWGSRLPGNIVFYIGRSQAYTGPLPVIRLQSVADNAFPPQRKSFAMIQHIANNFLGDFEWFMRADDDLFLKPDKLEQFLRRINSSKPLYIGSPGFGKEIEIGNLGLHNNDAFCMGGPGVVFTKSTLLKFKNHITDCINNTYTLHEDTELGRCVQKYADIGCTKSYEMGKLFLQNYNDSKGSFIKKLTQLEERAITLHPVKQNIHMYRLQAHFNTINLRTLRDKVELLKEEIHLTNYLLEMRQNGMDFNSKEITRHKFNEVNGWVIKDEDEFSISEDSPPPENWNVVIGDVAYSISGFQNPTGSVTPHQNLSTNRMRGSINQIKEYNQKTSLFLNVTYHRLVRGVYLEHIILKNMLKTKVASFRSVQLFHDLEFREQYTELPDVIWIILPVYKESKAFEKFISNISENIEYSNTEIRLQVILYHDDDDDYKKTKQYLHSISKLKHQIYFVYDSSTRNNALSSALEGLSNRTLLLFMTVHIYFNSSFLQRVLINTEYNEQVYFPIRFSQFAPLIVCGEQTRCNNVKERLDNKVGFWREQSYGIFSLYKGDLSYLQLLNTTSTNFFERCVISNLTVFRAVDPDLIEQHHNRQCNKTMDRNRYESCLNARNDVFGDESSLFSIVDKHKINI